MSERADTILKDARVYTGNDDQPRASVVAIRDKEIVYVGERGDGSWQDLVGHETNVVDLGERTITSGLVDSHTHPELVALSSWHISLPPTDDLNTILDFLRGYAAAYPCRRRSRLPDGPERRGTSPSRARRRVADPGDACA